MDLKNLVNISFIVYAMLIFNSVFLQNMYIGLELTLAYIVLLSLIFGIIVMKKLNSESFIVGVGLVFSSMIYISILIACVCCRYYISDIFIIFAILNIVLALIIYISKFKINFQMDFKNLYMLILFLGCIPLISAILSYSYYYLKCTFSIDAVYLFILSIGIFGLFHSNFRNYSIVSNSIALLIPRYVFRSDIGETVMPSILSKLGYWTLSFPMLHNSLAFNSVVYTSISLVSSSNVLASMKIISIFVFSLIPVAIYNFVSNYFDNDTAYISALLFMFFFWYYATSSRRQLSAEFFLVIFLLILSMELKIISKSILLTIFGSSICLSHYGVAYIFLYIIVIYYVVSSFTSLNIKLIQFNFILYILVLVLSWYIYTSFSLGYSVFLLQLEKIINNFCKFGFINIAKSEGLKVAITKYSLDIQFLKFLNLIIIFFALFGIYKFRKTKKQVMILSLPTVLLMCFIMLPIGGGFDISRMYSIFLIFAASFSVSIVKKHLDSKFTILSIVFLILYLFANCGVMSSILHDYSPNMYSNYYQIIESKNYYALYLLYRDYIRPEQNFQLKYWVVKYVYQHRTIFADEISAKALLSCRYIVNLEFPRIKMLGWSGIERGDFLYLSYLNILTHRLYIVKESLKITYLNRLHPKLLDFSKIYVNGRSSLYLY